MDKFFCHHQYFQLKNTFKVALHFLFNVFILLTQFLTLNLTLNKKQMQKCLLLKTWRKFAKNIWLPYNK